MLHIDIIHYYIKRCYIILDDRWIANVVAYILDMLYILDDTWIPRVSAYCFASSVLTTFFETRSHLLPTSILFTFSFAYLHELSAVSATKYDSGNVINVE